MKKPDKFQVGDSAWLMGDPYRRPMPWMEYKVLERTKTGYIMRLVVSRSGRINWDIKVSTVKAKRSYLTTTEKEDQDWAGEHRYRIAKWVGLRIDDAMLRKVADLIGYVPAEVTH